MPNNRWADLTFTPNNVFLIAGGRNYDLVSCNVEANRIAEESGARIEFRSIGYAKQVLLLRSTEDVKSLIAALQKAIGVSV